MVVFIKMMLFDHKWVQASYGGMGQEGREGEGR
jgi:hypothetical protein